MNDWTAQKVHSNSCNGQSILSERLYSKIIFNAGLTDETKIIFLKLGIWRRHKQNIFISWFAINFHERLKDGWKIHHHGRCMIMKRHNGCFRLGLTKSDWSSDWRKINTRNRQTYYATKTNRIQREIEKHGLWRILIVTVIVRFMMWNISRWFKTYSNERRNGSRKRMIE